MPALKKSQNNTANALTPNAQTLSGSKRPPQGIVKKKKKLVKFQKSYQQQEDYQRPKYQFTTDKAWQDFMIGKCLDHGKSEQGYQIAGVNWYWCNICKRYTKDHNTRLHSHAVTNNQNSNPSMVAAKTVSQRAQPLPARANVASVPSDPPTPFIEELDETIHPVDEGDYDYATEEEK